MTWIGGLAGLVLAAILSDWFGSPGVALALLGGIAGAFLMRMQGQVNALREEMKTLRAAQPREAASAPRVIARAPQAAPEPDAHAMPVAPVATFTPAPTVVPRPLFPDEPVPTPRDTPPMPLEAAAPVRRPEPLRVDEHRPAVTSSLGASLLAWFRGGNTIVRVAALILFIGVAFLLRYAAEHSKVPLEVRLAGIACGGVLLTVIGLRLTPKRRGYGLSLQGTGLGISYLTLFAAFRLYALLPAGLAFALLAAMAVITTVLALRQDALPLAVLGFGGAFLAPVLASNGGGSHVALFSYQLMLNVAIAIIARQRAWKLLNLEGFLFTFGIGALWGVSSYTPEQFWSTEPFLLANFLLYLFITVQYAIRLSEAEDAKLPIVDGGLLFGTPIVAFGLQAAMLREQPMALAFSAACISALYLFLGQKLWRRAGQRMLLLVEGMAALGLVFMALVIPLALDARWNGTAWALQGLGALWVALRQRRWWAAGLGLLLQLLAMFSAWNWQAMHAQDRGSVLFFNSSFLALLVPALTALVSARLLHRRRQSQDGELPALFRSPLLELPMLALGQLCLWASGWRELESWNQQMLDTAVLASLWFGAMALGNEIARRLLRWPVLLAVGRIWMVLAILASLSNLFDATLDGAGWTHYLARGGWAEAPALLALGAWRVTRQRSENISASTDAMAVIAHLAAAWYAMAQGGSWLYLLATQAIARHEGWTPAAAMLLPTLLGLAVIARSAPPRWPLLLPADARVYLQGLLRPWALLLILWVLIVNAFCDGAMAPLPYLPLLNPLDLAHGLALLFAMRLASSSGPTRIMPTWLVPALAFWWINGLLIRSLHHWARTPMWLDGALDAGIVQTSLTVLWTLSAMGLMLWATHRKQGERARPIWMVGAVLLGIVVVKLFLVDLASVGSLMRIVSFMAVGGLMLVIGYFAPLPPANVEKSS